MSDFLKIISPLYGPAISGPALALLLGIGYCWQNESGHTAVNPLITLLVFAPVVAAGIAGIFISAQTRFPAAILTITGIAGMALGVFVSQLGILTEYEKWTAAGMPERNPQSATLLAAFTAATIAGVLVTALSMRQAASKTDP